MFVKGLDAAVIHEFLAKNGQFILPFLQNQGMTTSSDEDEENSRTSFKIQDSCLNVVLKQEENSDGEAEQQNKSKPSLEVARIEEIGDDNPQQDSRNSKKQAAFENLLKTLQKSHESDKQRNSRNSQRSKQSRKSQAAAGNSNASMRRSQRKSKIQKSADDDLLNISDLNLHLQRELNGHALKVDNNSLSYSSTENMDVPLGILLHSSYSGVSATDKPHSRNSKTSCDVGIQANAYEISSQTFESYDDNDELKQAMRIFSNRSKRKSGYEAEMANATELQSLMLQGSNNKAAHIKSSARETSMIMSESEKLKMLLLPSK